MKKIRGMLILLSAVLGAAVHAEDVAVRLGESDFIIPLKQVDATQLYSFKEGKGYPAVESVLARRKTWKLSVGAAAELGKGVNVPFVSASTRLSPIFFDTGNNDLYFGLWVGNPSHGDKVIWGLSASTALW
jgi:hypothetical protein